MTEELCELDAVALAAGIAARRFSCAEVMASSLARISATNKSVNAIIALRDPDTLLTEARALDEALAGGAAPGPLCGFPVAVKDLAAVAGLPFTKGSPALRDNVASADSLMVARMKAAGAIVIGKTNVPEFGLGSQTSNPVWGATRNPYDLSRTAGGSSGGAAVALAMRMIPVADGTDFGGSLRNPAGWNNVWGFRPSVGRVPRDASDRWLPSMSVSGPMARNVPDLALLLSVQAGGDARDPLSQETDGASFRDVAAADLRGKRIAWAGDWRGAIPFEPDALALGRSAMRVFEDLGAVVEEATPDFPFEEMWRAFVRLRHWQSATDILELYNDPARRALLKPEAVWEVEQAMALSALDITAASQTRTRFTLAVTRFLERYDILALPTAQLFPFDVEMMWPREVGGRPMRSYHEWMQCVIPATMAGLPVAAAPAGFGEEGLPLGVQLIGRPRGEKALLAIAAAYDEATQWPRKRPPPGLPG